MRSRSKCGSERSCGSLRPELIVGHQNKSVLMQNLLVNNVPTVSSFSTRLPPMAAEGARFIRLASALRVSKGPGTAQHISWVSVSETESVLFQCATLTLAGHGRQKEQNAEKKPQKKRSKHGHIGTHAHGRERRTRGKQRKLGSCNGTHHRLVAVDCVVHPVQMQVRAAAAPPLPHGYRADQVSLYDAIKKMMRDAGPGSTVSGWWYWSS